MDELSPEAEAKDMELAATRAPGAVRHSGMCAVRGAGQGLEHQDQAPIGVVEVRQVKSAKGRGPPGVGYVSMTHAGKRRAQCN